MKFGLEERHWRTIDTLAIEPLKKCGARVWIFGSRARASHHPFSDIDILYRIDSGTLPAFQKAMMVESLEQSNLPIKVDLVEESDVVQSYLSQILADRIEV
jgi:predicted nucleotidyltransferase